jgi:O-methyltransferase
VKQLYTISLNVDSPHTQEEILSYIQTILSLPSNSKGVLVEAGCYKGSSTAKFSFAANIVGKELVVFDSFQGIPQNVEQHEKTIFGEQAGFKQGDYCGILEEVKTNVSRFGNINCCRFILGWFDDTMPKFKAPISAIYLDVDLASSTRTCLKYLYPLLEPGGVLYSQDGHLPLVINVFDDDNFWLSEVGCEKPQILGLWKKKLIKVIK